MIVAEALTKYFGERLAVDEASFEIPDGEVVGFLGLNGAGKTTLLRMLAGDLLPSGGRILVDGLDLADRPRQLGRQVGFLPERPPLYQEMTVREFLLHIGRLRGLPGAELAAATERAVAQTILGEVIGERVSDLSHGFQKRVGIAQAIIHSPKLVILDEPTSGLDPVQLVEMRGLVRSLAGGRTVLVSSHQLPEVRETCDRLLLLRRGRIVASGTSEELNARLAGASELEVTVRGPADKVRQVLLAVDGVSAVDTRTWTDDEITCALQGAGDLRAPVARAVVEAELDLLRLGRPRDELENVFLELTREPGTAEVSHA